MYTMEDEVLIKSSEESVDEDWRNVSATDAVIICKDGEVKAHRLLLCHMSRVLDMSFRGNEIPGFDLVCSIPDLGRRELLQMLDLAYIGKCICRDDEEYRNLLAAISFLKWLPGRGLLKVPVDEQAGNIAVLDDDAVRDNVSLTASCKVEDGDDEKSEVIYLGETAAKRKYDPVPQGKVIKIGNVRGENVNNEAVGAVNTVEAGHAEQVIITSKSGVEHMFPPGEKEHQDLKGETELSRERGGITGDSSRDQMEIEYVRSGEAKEARDSDESSVVEFSAQIDQLIENLLKKQTGVIAHEDAFVGAEEVSVISVANQDERMDDVQSESRDTALGTKDTVPALVEDCSSVQWVEEAARLLVQDQNHIEDAMEVLPITHDTVNDPVEGIMEIPNHAYCALGTQKNFTEFATEHIDSWTAHVQPCNQIGIEGSTGIECEMVAEYFEIQHDGSIATTSFEEGSSYVVVYDNDSLENVFIPSSQTNMETIVEFSNEGNTLVLTGAKENRRENAVDASIWTPQRTNCPNSSNQWPGREPIQPLHRITWDEAVAAYSEVAVLEISSLEPARTEQEMDSNESDIDEWLPGCDERWYSSAGRNRKSYQRKTYASRSSSKIKETSNNSLLIETSGSLKNTSPPKMLWSALISSLTWKKRVYSLFSALKSCQYYTVALKSLAAPDKNAKPEESEERVKAMRNIEEKLTSGNYDSPIQLDNAMREFFSSLRGICASCSENCMRLIHQRRINLLEIAYEKIAPGILKMTPFPSKRRKGGRPPLQLRVDMDDLSPVPPALEGLFSPINNGNTTSTHNQQTSPQPLARHTDGMTGDGGTLLTATVSTSGADIGIVKNLNKDGTAVLINNVWIPLKRALVPLGLPKWWDKSKSDDEELEVSAMTEMGVPVSQIENEGIINETSSEYQISSCITDESSEFVSEP